MPILSIAAPCDGSGKTTLAAGICAAFPGRLAFVQFATSPPGTRREIRLGAAAVAASRAELARLLAAGARSVLHCTCPPDGYPALCAELREEHVAEGEAVLTEGNTAAGILCPDLLLFVWNPHAPRERWEDSGWRLLAGADAVVANPYRPERGFDPAAAGAELLDKAGRTRPDAIRVTADVSRPPSEWGDAALFGMLRRFVP
jgi:hypothetical protein